MARTNKKAEAEKVETHGGATTLAVKNPEELLRRSVMSCLLWEDEFYEDGQSIADRISKLCDEVKPSVIAKVAIEARETGIRHAALLLLVNLARRGSGDGLVARTIERVIKRADELCEYVSLYWKLNPRRPNGRPAHLSAQSKIGLAAAFNKFDAYRLAKYDRKTEVKLRDVLRIVHPHPKDAEMERVFKGLIDGTLESPDTWEVALSSGADKKETFERLLREENLGYLALLRNLRNMENAKVDRALIKKALAARKGAAMVFPFRFFAAAIAAPSLADDIDKAMLAHLAQLPKLPGKTIVVIDVSGSMYGGAVSRNSDMSRAHAACALGAICREVCEDPIIYATAGNDWKKKHETKIVPSIRGIALSNAIYELSGPMGGGGIFLNQAMRHIEKDHPEADRVIVITDEQDTSSGSEDSPARAPLLGKKNYIINVSSYDRSIKNDRWTTIHGFSENVLKYIYEVETSDVNSRRDAALSALAEADAPLLDTQGGA